MRRLGLAVMCRWPSFVGGRFGFRPAGVGVTLAAPRPERQGCPMADATTDIIVAALKRALAEPGEQRLFKSGKLAGLFPGRSGASAEAAIRALREGLIETVRTETRGKTVVEWARATPRGVAFLHAHESPRAVLRELLDALRTAQTGAPLWLEGMRREWDEFADRLGAQLQQYLRQLDALKARVEEGLR